MTSQELEAIRWELRKGMAIVRGWESIDPVDEWGFIGDWNAVFAPPCSWYFDDKEEEAKRRCFPSLWTDPRSLEEIGLYHCRIPDYLDDAEATEEAIEFFIGSRAGFRTETYFKARCSFWEMSRLVEQFLLWSNPVCLRGTLVSAAWTVLVLAKRMDFPWEPSADYATLRSQFHESTKELYLPKEKIFSERADRILCDL